MTQPQFSPIEQKFASKGIVRHGLLFVDAQIAADLIATGRSAGVPILGVDSFTLVGEATHALSDHCLDLSEPGGNDTWRIAARFVQDRAHCGFHFEITLDD